MSKFFNPYGPASLFSFDPNTPGLSCPSVLGQLLAMVGGDHTQPKIAVREARTYRCVRQVRIALSYLFTTILVQGSRRNHFTSAGLPEDALLIDATLEKGCGKDLYLDLVYESRQFSPTPTDMPIPLLELEIETMPDRPGELVSLFDADAEDLEAIGVALDGLGKDPVTGELDEVQVIIDEPELDLDDLDDDDDFDQSLDGWDGFDVDGQ